MKKSKNPSSPPKYRVTQHLDPHTLTVLPPSDITDRRIWKGKPCHYVLLTLPDYEGRYATFQGSWDKATAQVQYNVVYCKNLSV